MMTQISDELAQLQAMHTRLQQENQALEADKKSLTADNIALEYEIKSLSTENATLKEKLELALAQLNVYRSKRFGQQTEKAAKGTFNEAELHSTFSPAHHKKGYVRVSCCGIHPTGSNKQISDVISVR